MRTFASILALVGAIGIVLSIVIMARTIGAPGNPPFTHEGYGGPGPLLGGILLLIAGLYLRASAREG
jgi:hypothetical protein